EPDYFSHNYYKGIDWYKNQFENIDNILLDASTTYTMAKIEHQAKKPDFSNIPSKVYSLNPNAKFIYLLRDPIDRAYSGYWQSVRNGRTNESFGTLIRNKMFHHLDTSNYHAQLQLWLEYFSIESFLLIEFEDLINQQDKTLEE